MIKNNVTRLLESRKIPFATFELPPDKLGAVETADRLGVPIEIVLKTIVVLREKPGKPILAVVPGNREVNIKLAAQAAGEKKLHLPTEREAEKITGLQAGGISPLALINKGFQVFIDSSVSDKAEIHISGGQRGLNIRLPVTELVALTNARFAQLTEII